MFRGRIFEYVSKNICGIMGVNKFEFVELINADYLFLHKPHTPNYRKGS